MKLYYVKLLWFNDNTCKKVPEELFVNADDYADAVAQVVDGFKDSIISIALYEVGGPFLYVADLKDTIDEGRKAVNIPDVDNE